MKTSKLDVAYKKDIVKLTAERLDLPPERVLDVVNFSFKYLYKLMEEEDTATIEMPGLGRFFLQFVEYYRMYQRTETSQIRFPVKTYHKLPNIRKKVLRLLNDRIVLIGKYHKKKPRFKNTRLTMKMSVEEMENFQNNVV